MRKFPQELLLMNDCPECGQKVNRKFVENIIDEIENTIKKQIVKDIKTLIKPKRWHGQKLDMAYNKILEDILILIR